MTTSNKERARELWLNLEKSGRSTPVDWCNAIEAALDEAVKEAVRVERGRNLYRTLAEAYPKPEGICFTHEMLPEYPHLKQVVLTTDKLKEFNANLREVAEFAAWVCGVEFEKFNRLSMVAFIRKSEFALANNRILEIPRAEIEKVLELFKGAHWCETSQEKEACEGCLGKAIVEKWLE